MAKINTYVSNQGEVFEGTQAELMREKGITRKASFKQPSGAPDRDGDRWKLEGEDFSKPTLYLGIRRRSTRKGKDGKPEAFWEAYSEVAGNYMSARDYVASGKTEYRDECLELMKTVEGTYTLVDIDVPEVIFGLDHKKPYKPQLTKLQDYWNNLHKEAAKAMIEDRKADYYTIKDILHNIDITRSRGLSDWAHQMVREGVEVKGPMAEFVQDLHMAFKAEYEANA